MNEELAIINAFFSEAINQDNKEACLERKIGQTSTKISKDGDIFLFSDSVNTLRISQEHLPEFLRYAVEEQPNTEALTEKYEGINKLLQQKKAEGTLIETSPNRFVTTSNRQFEFKPAFGTLWLTELDDTTGNIYYREGEEGYDKILRDLMTSGFLSDPSMPINPLHISDSLNRAINFPGNETQQLVLDLIRENASKLGEEHPFFEWGIDGSRLADKPSEPKVVLLMNGEVVAEPYIAEDHLKFKIISHKEEMKEVLPNFCPDSLRPNKMKVRDILRVADSVAVNSKLRLSSKPFIYDVFRKEDSRSILVNGYRSVKIADSFILSDSVYPLIEVPFLSEKIDLELLKNTLSKAVILEFQSYIYYSSVMDLVRGQRAVEINRTFSQLSYEEGIDHVEKLHKRLIALGGNSSHYSNPNTWEAMVGVAQVVTDVPYDPQTAVSNAISMEMLSVQIYTELVAMTKDIDIVTCSIAEHILKEEQEHLTRLQQLLTDINLS